MKLNSKYFDSIRVEARGCAERAAERDPSASGRAAKQLGSHRAPKGRGQRGPVLPVCLDHVRQFNASYNYFEGWSTADVEAFQKDAVIGHRPTWKASSMPTTRRRARLRFEDGFGRRFEDPHAFFLAQRVTAASKTPALDAG